MILVPPKSVTIDGEACEIADNPPPTRSMRRVPEGFACLEPGEEWADDTTAATIAAPGAGRAHNDEN